MNESSFLSFFAKCGKAVMQGSLDYNHLQDRKRRWLKSFWAKAIAFFFSGWVWCNHGISI